MATLTGNTVQSTYKSLIKIGDNSELNASTPEALTDGFGNAMPLEVSQTQIKFTGILDADSATSILGFDAPKNIIIDGVGTWSATQAEDTVTFAGGTDIGIALAGDTITFSYTGTGGATDTGSLLVTASNDFSQITFTKGDGTTFDLDTTPNQLIGTVKNISGGTLLKGTPVHVTASASPPSGFLSEVVAADASDPLLMPCHYILAQDLDDGEEGFGILSGKIQGVDTQTPGFSEGDTIYVAAGGGYTNVKPQGTNLIQNIGVITKVDTTNGGGEVFGAGRTNDLPNLQSGYAWVGDANGVPEQVATSSFAGGVTINNNTSTNILTATGTANTIDGEPLFRYDNLTGTVYLDYAAGSGLVLDAGTIPSVNPSIGVQGFFTNLEFANDVITSNNIILRDQAKIVFDNDTANTFIAADLSTPENLTINADGHVDVYVADGFRVWEQNSTPAPIFVVEPFNDFPRVAIGQNATTTTSELYVDGRVEAQYHLYDYNGTALTFQGEIVNWGTTSTTAGKLYYWTGTAWALADADVLSAASSLLAIATSNNSGKGMLLQGWVKAASGLANGQLYMSPTAGEYTTTQPSATGQYVRVIGHGMNDLTFRFNPSNDFYEVE